MCHLSIGLVCHLSQFQDATLRARDGEDTNCDTFLIGQFSDVFVVELSLHQFVRSRDVFQLPDT